MKHPLVSTAWLEAHLSDSDLVVIEATMNQILGRDEITYASPMFIPRTRRVNIDTELSDTDSLQVHAFPTVEQFNAFTHKQGITPTSTVVIYDNQGVYCAPRAWWIFKAMGFEQVFILDGGLPQWLAEKRPVVAECDAFEAVADHFRGTFAQDKVTTIAGMQDNLVSACAVVIDARSSARFSGEAAEPRPGMRSGHIPNSKNLPFAEVFNGHVYRSSEALQKRFSALGCEPSERLVFTCGSGITACIIMVAAIIAGFESVSLYDGSWSEWGSTESLPVATGA